MKLYLNQYGIYGAEIADNLEEILPKTMDAIRFQIEVVPVPVFRTGFIDLEYLKDFDPVSDYLDPQTFERGVYRRRDRILQHH